MFQVGDLVHEANCDWHFTPARIEEIIESHGSIYYKIRFRFHEILKRQILPEYRLTKYEKK